MIATQCCEANGINHAYPTITLTLYVKLERPCLNKGGGPDISYQATYNAVAPFPDSLTTIHTRANQALATHMKAGWVHDPQVALTTLKLRAHKYPERVCEDTRTQRWTNATVWPYSLYNYVFSQTYISLLLLQMATFSGWKIICDSSHNSKSGCISLQSLPNKVFQK